MELIEFQESYAYDDGTPHDPILRYVQRDEWEALLEEAGTPMDASFDLFSVANGTLFGGDPQLASALRFQITRDDHKQRFQFLNAFRAKLGIPGSAEAEANGTLQEYLDSLPDILQLNTITDISLSLTCEEFQIVHFNWDSWSTADSRYTRWDQEWENPWTLESSVDLQWNSTDFQTLPQDVQDQMMTLSDSAFSIEQLLFDVTQSELMSPPVVAPGVPPDARKVLVNYFIPMYFDSFLKNGGPVLGYAGTTDEVASDGSLKLNDYRLEVSPYKDPESGLEDVTNRKFNTLTYLCMSDPNKPIPTSEKSRVFDFNVSTLVPDSVFLFVRDANYRTSVGRCERRCIARRRLDQQGAHLRHDT